MLLKFRKVLEVIQGKKNSFYDELDELINYDYDELESRNNVSTSNDKQKFVVAIHEEIRPLLNIVDAEYYSDDFYVINLYHKIEKPYEGEYVANPDYFPCYDHLTPQQRYLFFEFLSDPFCENGWEKYDIGYVFCLFYILEKHLEEGSNDIQAFNVLLRLRQIYNNKSFQRYSLIAMVGYCFDKRKEYLIGDLSKSCGRIDGLPLNLYILFCSECGRMFTYEDLWKYRNCFDVSLNVSPRRTEKYISVLHEKMMDYFGTDSIDPKILVADAMDFPKESIAIYTGINFNCVLQIPDFTQIPLFCVGCRLCIDETIAQFKKDKWSKENIQTHTFHHHSFDFNQNEEIFYRVLCEAIENYTNISYDDLSIRILKDGTMVYSFIFELGRIKLTGDKYKILVFRGDEKEWQSIDTVYDAIPLIPLWLKRVKKQ